MLPFLKVSGPVGAVAPGNLSLFPGLAAQRMHCVNRGLWRPGEGDMRTASTTTGGH